MKLPQLSLRDLLWLVVVAAVLCGWWQSDLLLNAARIEAEQKQAEAEALLELQRAEHAIELSAVRSQVSQLRIMRFSEQRSPSIQLP